MEKSLVMIRALRNDLIRVRGTLLLIQTEGSRDIEEQRACEEMVTHLIELCNATGKLLTLVKRETSSL